MTVTFVSSLSLFQVSGTFQTSIYLISKYARKLDGLAATCVRNSSTRSKRAPFMHDRRMQNVYILEVIFIFYSPLFNCFQISIPYFHSLVSIIMNRLVYVCFHYEQIAGKVCQLLFNPCYLRFLVLRVEQDTLLLTCTYKTLNSFQQIFIVDSDV